MGRIRRRAVKHSARRAIPKSAIRKHNRRRKRSALEITVGDWLTEDGIVFKREKAVGQCHVDIFLEPNICVELQGCYFHAHNCMTKMDAKRADLIRKKDARRFAFLRNRGYLVIEVWECDVHKHPDLVRSMLRGLNGK